MKKGFTLIEILITLSIIGLLATISIFGIAGARESARDAKRKADLQNIRSAFELYYSDCGQYPPPVSSKVPTSITSGSYTSPPARPVSCPSNVSPSVQNVYLTDVPNDPLGNVSYDYLRPSLSSYVLCAHLEGGETTADSACSGLTCANGVCNFSVSGP